MRVVDKNGAYYDVTGLLLVAADGKKYELDVGPDYNSGVILGNAFDLTQMHPLVPRTQ